jgi:L-2,4-diaminobutyrate decarboxylase
MDVMKVNSSTDSEFASNRNGLLHAIELMEREYPDVHSLNLPTSLPENGLGSLGVPDRLAPAILGGAATLGGPRVCANMDPPTPWLTWATTLRNAALNQNLLHPSTAPIAREVEELVVSWLAPFLGMRGGHMTAGSTLANLTGLWAARECAGIKEVIASDSAHLSIAKAAQVLGLRHTVVPSKFGGALLSRELPQDCTRAALVLTAGTTGTGAIDPLELAGQAAWTHVDAAWGGPLRLTKHAGALAGIERADSVSMSAHKWFFQPKESALILFRDSTKAHRALSFGGDYLAVPNVGLLGSHGAAAVPLLATLLAWGREGIAARIERCMAFATRLAQFVEQEPRFNLLAPPQTGIVVWRPHDTATSEQIYTQLPAETVSVTKIAGERWFRCVAANPNVDFDRVADAFRAVLADVI